LSVELFASEAAIEARIGASQRKHFKKITELSLYRELRSGGAFNSPVIPRSDLRIDTGKNSADEAARQIVAHFKLNEQT